MSFSLNETAALAKRATRGAGYPWGLAEEAGWSVRWLCTHRQDGTAALARLLQLELGRDLDQHKPDRNGSIWKGQRRLCPLASGAALSDFAACLKSERFEIHAVAEPLLILPFAAAAARRIGMSVRVQSETVSAVVDGRGLALNGVFEALTPRLHVAAEKISINPGKTRSRARPAQADWDMLNRFTDRTYAPATETSRRLGAGAGQTDND